MLVRVGAAACCAGQTVRACVRVGEQVGVRAGVWSLMVEANKALGTGLFWWLRQLGD
jgi:hypothetical protein